MTTGHRKTQRDLTAAWLETLPIHTDGRASVTAGKLAEHLNVTVSLAEMILKSLSRITGSGVHHVRGLIYDYRPLETRKTMKPRMSVQEPALEWVQAQPVGTLITPASVRSALRLGEGTNSIASALARIEQLDVGLRRISVGKYRRVPGPVEKAAAAAAVDAAQAALSRPQDEQGQPPEQPPARRYQPARPARSAAQGANGAGSFRAAVLGTASDGALVLERDGELYLARKL